MYHIPNNIVSVCINKLLVSHHFPGILLTNSHVSWPQPWQETQWIRFSIACYIIIISNSYLNYPMTKERTLLMIKPLFVELSHFRRHISTPTSTPVHLTPKTVPLNYSRFWLTTLFTNIFRFENCLSRIHKENNFHNVKVYQKDKQRTISLNNEYFLAPYFN